MRRSFSINELKIRGLLKELFLYILTFLYILIGIKHFTNLDFFLAIVPPYFPFHHFMVYSTGVLEIVFGLMMIFRKTRFYGCWGIFFLLIAVFPANIYLYMSELPRTFLSVTKHDALIRLPYQLPLLLFAYWHSKEKTSKILDFFSIIIFPPTIYYFLTL